jgi:hypothetical protein
MKLHETSARLTGLPGWPPIRTRGDAYLNRRRLAYQQQRYLRTGQVQIMARVYGEFYHARDVAAELRNRMLAARTPQDSYEGIAGSTAANNDHPADAH